MKFTKDKKYNFLSYSKPFKVEYFSKAVDKKFKEILRWRINNYRGFSTYDSPKAEYKGRYVKCNYKLELCFQINKDNGEKTFLPNGDDWWNFHTKKELNHFLNNFNECMKKGISEDYGYYNNEKYKII